MSIVSQGKKRGLVLLVAPILITHSLSFGSSGTEVKALQQILNSDSRTQVNASGVGSPGFESSYFGDATRAAVIRFQDLYRNELLLPQGLIKGNGFVGAATRRKLNALISAPIATSTATVPNEKLELYYPSTYETTRGGTVELAGSGFNQNGTTVHFGDQFTLVVKAVSSSKLSFVVPSDAPLGKYELSLSDGDRKSTFTKPLVIKNSGVADPVVTSVSPRDGLYGSHVTITGSGFTPDGNDIYTTYDIIRNVSSPDGKTLSFDILPFPGTPELQVGRDYGKGYRFDVYMYVINANGMSQAPGVFTLKF